MPHEFARRRVHHIGRSNRLASPRNLKSTCHNKRFWKTARAALHLHMDCILRAETYLLNARHALTPRGLFGSSVPSAANRMRPGPLHHTKLTKSSWKLWSLFGNPVEFSPARMPVVWLRQWYLPTQCCKPSDTFDKLLDEALLSRSTADIEQPYSAYMIFRCDVALHRACNRRAAMKPVNAGCRTSRRHDA
jgi:hypothetical protein